MKKTVLLYIKLFFILLIAQLISGNGMTAKTIGYSLLGAAVWVLLLTIISRFTYKEK